MSSANADLLADQEGVGLVFCGHSHGPAIYMLRGDEPARTQRAVLDPNASVDVRLEEGCRYVVDAGSLGRPGFHPEPGRFDLATYAVFDAGRRVVSLRTLSKRPR